MTNHLMRIRPQIFLIRPIDFLYDEELGNAFYFVLDEELGNRFVIFFFMRN